MTAGQGLAERTIASLMPRRREVVYEILRDELHADVSDWSNYKKGATAPAANPKYCYEWCFTQGDSLVVLNLWHASFRADGNDVVCELNMRAYANEIARAKDEPWREKKPKPVWEKRARKMDLALQLAVRKRLTIRVIICEGSMRDLTAGDEKASEVKLRMLDPVAWGIDSYDPGTGQTLLRRGLIAPSPGTSDPLAVESNALAPTRTVSETTPGPLTELPRSGPAEPEYTDQFDTELATSADRRETTGSVFVRSSEVRAAALRRARGLCQLCGQPGFLTAAGKVYLETHHVQPLGEGGRDALSNVVALCATDHRRAHFELDSAKLRVRLLQIASRQD